MSIQLVGVMGTSPPYGFGGHLRTEHYRIDGGASSWLIEPLARKVSSEYASGQLPLWNENQGFGSPLLANAESGGLDLLRLPVFVSGSSVMWDFYYLARIILGGLATYLFARAVKLVWPARYFLAISYVFSGHFFILGNNFWIEAYFLLPVILLGTELTVTGGIRVGFVVTAIAVAFNILVGMPEVTLFVLAQAAAYGFYRTLRLASEVGGWRLVIPRGGILVGSWIVGIAIAAPLLVTLFEFVAHSSKIVSDRSVNGLYYAPLRDFAIWFIPYLNGRPLDPGAVNFINNYVGTTVLILALYGLYPTRTHLYWRLVPFAALAVVLLLAKTFGVPIINELGRLPGLNVTWITKWSAPLTGFCLALLASVGVHNLATCKIRHNTAAWALITFFWLSLLATTANWDNVSHMTANRLWETVGVSLLFATSVWVIVQLRRWLRPTLIGVACCCLVTLELFFYAPRGVYQDRYERFVEPPYVRFLKNQQADGPFRIFAFDGLMFPNSASVYGLDDIRSLDALYIDRYQAYVNNFITTLAPPYPFVGWSVPWGEKETRPDSSPWFDLTGVRYIISTPRTGALFARGNLIRAIIEKNADIARPPAVSAEVFKIDGASKPVLFEHPPASLRLPLTVTPDNAMLRFSLALSPEVWDASKGDGVGFAVSAELDDKSKVLYHREIDPKHDLSQRHWVEGSVDLSQYIGRDLVLVLTTDPLESADNDWAGWGDIRLTPASGEAQSSSSATGQYSLVYDAEVQIFENRHAMPRAFLVSSIVPVSNMNSAITAMKQPQIDPRRTAVVENISLEQLSALKLAEGTASIRSYSSSDAVVDVSANGESFLVFTDSIYPGWKATVDGHEIPIYATDLAFRGVFVPQGKHRVEFSYRPASFELGMAIATLALVVLAAVAIGFTPWRWFANSRLNVLKKSEAESSLRT
ncbi:MAG: YfhO family protein [Chloroflexi bacterium]|nr:YfhO family protein [Chloroflexota bacterium]